MEEDLSADMASMEVDAGFADEDGEILVEEEEDDAIADDDDEHIIVESEVPSDAIRDLPPHDDSVYAVAMKEFGDTRIIVTGGGDERAILSTTTTTTTTTIELLGHSDSVTCSGISRRGEFVATGSYDGSVKVWNARGALEKTLEGPGDVEWLEWHPRGEVIVAGARDGTCWLWDAIKGECLRVFVGHDGAVTCGLFTSDGNLVVTGSSDGTVRAWGPKKGVCRHSFASAAGFTRGPVVALHAHPTDPDLVAAAAEDGASVLHLKHKRVVAELDRGEEDTAVAFWGRWVAVGNVLGRLQIWDYTKPARRHDLELSDRAVVALDWHPTQPRLYVAAADGKLRNVDARSGDTLLVFEGATDALLAMAVVYAPTSDLVVAAGDDRIPRLFRADVVEEEGSSSSRFRLVKNNKGYY
ncbi:hypothetical protein CTAYLR_003522 [Chrysophaeum taylorii]|uniref:Uncharacterized protein n=1 Tax=Chrysophaeum taylorii TaxID=2483200 RepID=A0AAD7UCB2_9STRA|nr:hypothetical protein CTAYLR_003522 [Chrysophaeum taylorii]